MANTPLTELGADGGTSESLEPMTPSSMLETPHPVLEPATVEETADPPGGRRRRCVGARRPGGHIARCGWRGTSDR